MTTDVQRLVSDFQSPYWWMTAVFLAVLMNLFSTYLKTGIDRFLSKISENRRQSATKKNNDAEAYAKFLLSDTRLLIIATSKLQVLKIKNAALLVSLFIAFWFITVIPRPEIFDDRWFKYAFWFGLIGVAISLISNSQLTQMLSSYIDKADDILKDSILRPKRNRSVENAETNT